MNGQIDTMTKTRIEAAIARAQDGIKQYIEIMEMLHRVDVAESEYFQRKYADYYCLNLGNPSEKWRKTYYKTLQKNKKNPNINFECVLNRLRCIDKRCDFSFTSKLIATINPKKPPWDSNVGEFTGIARPPFEKANERYQTLLDWYDDFLQSPKGMICGIIFDMKVSNRYYKNTENEPVEFTEVKKIDFILWKYR